MSNKINSQVIRCINCGGDNLHHYSVEVFFRTLEDGNGTYVHADRDGMSVSYDDNMETNPSDRRDGVRMVLDCENCDGYTEINLVQHKGCTLLSTKDYLDK